MFYWLSVHVPECVCLKVTTFFELFVCVGEATIEVINQNGLSTLYKFKHSLFCGPNFPLRIIFVRLNHTFQAKLLYGKH